MEPFQGARFQGFIGNTSAKETLARMISSGRFPHALLITGPPGVGKRTFAKLAAMAMLCLGGADRRPCGECPACRKAKEGNHPDLHTPGDDNARSFKIGAVREMHAQLSVSPNEGEVAVWILGEAHTLTPQAANALLKVLEEPPRHVRFILTATSKERLPDTLISRLTVIPLRPVTASECEAELSLRLPDTPPEALRADVMSAGGCIGVAVTQLEERGFSERLAACREIALAVTKDDYTLLAALFPYERNRDGLDKTLARLELIFRDVAVHLSGGDTSLSGETELVRALSASLGVGGVGRMMEVLWEARRMNAANASGPLLTTWLAASLRGATGR